MPEKEVLFKRLIATVKCQILWGEYLSKKFRLIYSLGPVRKPAVSLRKSQDQGLCLRTKCFGTQLFSTKKRSVLLYMSIFCTSLPARQA